MNPKIISIVAEVFAVDPDTLKSETRFVEDLGADSLTMMEMFIQLQEHTGKTYAPTQIKMVGDLL